MAIQSKDNQDEKIVVFVDEDLRDLIPGYLENRFKDIATIQANLLSTQLFA